MKDCRNWQPRPATVARIEAARAVIDEAAQAGFRLTLRAVFYRLVARNTIPNTDRAYKNLSALLDKARWAGRLPFDCIDDPERSELRGKTWGCVRECLEDAAQTYRTDWWSRADPVVEVWSEKMAVAGILEGMAIDRYGLLFVAGLKYTSLTHLYGAARRFVARPVDTVILYVGDHDPSGLDMDRDIAARLKDLGRELKSDLSVNVKRVALTMDQIEEYGLPSQPTKATDSRAAKYVHDGSWELDALPAAVLYEVVEREIREWLPPDFAIRVENDYRGRSRLRDMAFDA